MWLVIPIILLTVFHLAWLILLCYGYLPMECSFWINWLIYLVQLFGALCESQFFQNVMRVGFQLRSTLVKLFFLSIFRCIWTCFSNISFNIIFLWNFGCSPNPNSCFVVSGWVCYFYSNLFQLQVAAIFRKSLKLTHEGRKNFPSGKITNMITTDANALQVCFFMKNY